MRHRPRHVDHRRRGRVIDGPWQEPRLGIGIPGTLKPINTCRIGIRIALPREIGPFDLIRLGHPAQRIRRIHIPLRRQILAIEAREKHPVPQHPHEDRNRPDRSADRRIDHRLVHHQPVAAPRRDILEPLNEKPMVPRRRLQIGPQHILGEPQ
jgi:hypothetical protein